MKEPKVKPVAKTKSKKIISAKPVTTKSLIKEVKDLSLKGVDPIPTDTLPDWKLNKIMKKYSFKVMSFDRKVEYIFNYIKKEVTKLCHKIKLHYEIKNSKKEKARSVSDVGESESTESEIDREGNTELSERTED